MRDVHKGRELAADRSGLDTCPKLLLDHANRTPNRHAIREKNLGIWQSWTWRQYGAEIRALACGLAAMGFSRGDKLAIIGDNRPELYGAMFAAQALGGILVPMYQDAVADEMQFVLEHAEIRFAVVEAQELTDKLLEVKDRCPQLEQIIYDDEHGLRHYQLKFLHAYKVGVKLLDGRSVSVNDRLLYRLGELCIYGPLKNTLGLSRIRIAYTAGEAIGPEIFEFYRSLGINIKQLYGQTESSVFVTIRTCQCESRYRWQTSARRGNHHR